MGMDLAVLPNRYYLFEGLNDGYNRLVIERDYELFKAIQKLPSQPLKQNQDVSYYGDEEIEDILVDAYGNQLHWIAASEFRKIAVVDLTSWNVAIMAFLQNLPPDMPVVLYWH